MKRMSLIRREILDVLFYGDEEGMKLVEIARKIRCSPENVRQVLYRMMTDGQVFRGDRGRYKLTDVGGDQLQGGRNRGVTAARWISDVRCGIDASGHETRIQRAKTPSVGEIRKPSTPPLEEWIDARRELEATNQTVSI